MNKAERLRLNAEREYILFAALQVFCMLALFRKKGVFAGAEISVKPSALGIKRIIQIATI